MTHLFGICADMPLNVAARNMYACHLQNCKRILDIVFSTSQSDCCLTHSCLHSEGLCNFSGLVLFMHSRRLLVCVRPSAFSG